MGWVIGRLRAGLRRRWAAFALLSALAAFVAAIAATTPILRLAVEQAALDHALASGTALQRSALSNASSDDEVTSEQSRSHAERALSPLGPSRDWTAVRTYREQNDQPLKWVDLKAGRGPRTQRLADIPSCAELRFISGRCPRSAGEAALADSTFRQQGVRLGERITLASPLRRVSVTVVGAYDSSTGAGRLEANPGRLADASYDGLDLDLLLTPAGFTTLRLPTTSFSIRTLATSVPLRDLPTIRQGIADARAVAFTASGASASTRVITTLDGLLDRIDEQRNVVAVILDVVSVGAFALALLAFAVIVQRLARVRAAEWALPRLRGLGRARRLAARLTEPLLAVCSGAAVGTAGGIGATSFVVDATTREALSSVLPVALALAGAAFACGVIALVLADAAADRRPLDVQLHRAAEPRELSRVALVGEAVTVVGALAAVVALLAEPGSAISGAGLLAPVLIALAIGFVVLQIALALVRRRTRRIPTSLTGLIVARRLSRSPSLLVVTVLLAAAVSLGTFVVMTSTTADALAIATAEAETAAPTVLHVQTPTDLSLLAAVSEVDPDGTRAMAAEEVLGREGIFRVLAVDTSRLAAVSTWRSQWAGYDEEALRRRLAPQVEPSLVIRGDSLTVRVDDIAPGPVDDGDQEFELQAALQSSHALTVVPLGTFGPSGAHTFSAAIPCAAGCTVVSFSVRCADQYKSPWSLHLLLTAISTDIEPADRFDPLLQHGRWITDNGHVLDPALPVSSTVAPGASGLAVDLNDSYGGGQPAFRVRDTVEPLPVLFGETTTADEFPGAAGTTVGTGIDGSAILIRPVGRASALPRLLGDGVLVDLRRLLPQIDSSTSRPDQQVWVTGDPGPLRRGLEALGVRVVGTDTLGGSIREHATEAGPLSARFSLVGASGVMVVVLLAVLGARLLVAPARRRQWSSFASAGVAPRQIRRLAALEFFVPAAAAVALGALAGTLAFALALAHLPLADAAPQAPPSGIDPPWVLIAVFPGLAIVATSLMTALVVRAETGSPRGGAR